LDESSEDGIIDTVDSNIALDNDNVDSDDADAELGSADEDEDEDEDCFDNFGSGDIRAMLEKEVPIWLFVPLCILMSYHGSRVPSGTPALIQVAAVLTHTTTQIPKIMIMYFTFILLL
jgi:hypothetical protein